MADERKDDGKAPHWTSASLTEAAAHPHPPEMKDQGGAGEGLSRSANGFPYREEEEGAFGEHGSQGTYSDTKENGINGELTSADRETAGNWGATRTSSCFVVGLQQLVLSFLKDKSPIRRNQCPRKPRTKHHGS